jgi:lysophospholipase L1-like esterase
VASWGASQQLVEPNNALAAADLHDATLRQIVHLSVGGEQIRLRLSNRFGATPLHLTAVHIARALSPASSKIDPATEKGVSFSGSAEIRIPEHADYLSDPIPFPAAALSDLAVTMHFDAAPVEQTGHPGSRATSYLVHENQVSVPEFLHPKTADHWYFLAAVDVTAAPDAKAIIILGDSITDGHGATTNGNDRWPDVLAQRLQAQPSLRNVAVINQGIGGNHLLSDGLGPNALSRLDQDVLAQPGICCLIVLEGINDVGLLARESDVPPAEHALMVRRITAAYEQIVARAHDHNVVAVGATILPFVGSEYYHPGPANEADRQAVNAWIRAAGHFDAVLDFDKLTRDPDHLERLLPSYDSGDHLHPSPAGYAAMAQSVPFSLFGLAPEPTSKTVQ